IFCRKHVSDMLSEALLCFGASSTSIDEPDKSKDEDEICINSIFTEDQDVSTCISHAADSIGLKEMPSYEVINNEKYEWIKKAKARRQFKVLRLGGGSQDEPRQASVGG
ncbi:Ribosomal l11 methyltransferase, partial [Thalictrum thalictroides]